ncbi:hypothetical protein GCM10023222_43000 [Saccharopolyspora cebuensis]
MNPRHEPLNPPGERPIPRQAPRPGTTVHGTEVTTMNETYAVPALVEVGDFAADTLGDNGHTFDGLMSSRT